jgi:hypothetical protein
MPTFSIPSPSKIYPNWDFWFENKPSGNPLSLLVCHFVGHSGGKSVSIRATICLPFQ